MSASDLDLIAEFRRNRSQDAFTALLRRHVDLVYCAALRQVRSAQLAEEVAQSVFLDLARSADRLKPDTVLSAWLYKVTRRTATNVVRAETRRKIRERAASQVNAMSVTDDWTDIEPFLDEAMDALEDADRTAVLLRYFENKSLREVGEFLGTTDDAAQKRVSRAVERLRRFFVKRGIMVSASALVVLISGHAIEAAPTGVFAAVSATAASAGTTLASASAATAAKAVAMSTLQKIIIIATIAAAAGVGIYEARRASVLRGRLQAVQQQRDLLLEQMAQLTNGTARTAVANGSSSLGTERLRELLKLRGEVAVLRRQHRELEAAAGAARPNTVGPAATALPQPIKPAPFQVQLVLDGPADNTEPMTNNAGSTGGETLHLEKTPLLDYTAVSSATVTKNPTSGAPEISIEFSPEGNELFAAVTKENINRRLAIVLDGRLYSAPVIRSEISGGKAQITGSFTAEEAAELAAKINESIGGW